MRRRGRPPKAPGARVNDVRKNVSMGEDMDYRMRAESLARAIAADLAHKIVQACSPDWRRQNAAQLRREVKP